MMTFSRSTCRLCKSPRLWTAIPLPGLPLASPNVGSDADLRATAPADVYQCEDCGFLQLNTIVDPELQYRNFRYLTGISVGLREHFKTLIDGLARRGDIGKDKFVFDIGSNDGSLLRYALEHGARVLGIDPASAIAVAASESGIPTIGDFFTARKAAEIAAEHGPADVVICNNTLANIDDLDDMFSGIDTMLDRRGILVVETQYALDVLEKTLLDVIYHEHISYFSVAPMQKYAAARGFELVDAERIAPKGGSIRFFVQKRGGGRAVSPRVDELIAAERPIVSSKDAFAAFNARIADLRRDLHERLQASRRKAGRAIAYGSSVGCAALVNYLDLGNMIDAVFDDTPLAPAIQSPHGAIPVLDGRELADEPATEIAVLAWRYTAEIAKRQASYRAKGGRFYRVLPDLAFIDTNGTR